MPQHARRKDEIAVSGSRTKKNRQHQGSSTDAAGRKIVCEENHPKLRVTGSARSLLPSRGSGAACGLT